MNFRNKRSLFVSFSHFLGVNSPPWLTSSCQTGWLEKESYPWLSRVGESWEVKLTEGIYRAACRMKTEQRVEGHVCKTLLPNTRLYRVTWRQATITYEVHPVASNGSQSWSQQSGMEDQGVISVATFKGETLWHQRADKPWRVQMYRTGNSNPLSVGEVSSGL